MNEWTFGGEISRGASGRQARRVQEWLCLHAVQVSVDGAFGPATAEGVRQFQTRKGLPATGRVDQDTFEALVEPLIRARRTMAPDGQPLGALVAAYATQHLAEHPREVGGQNRGPWVRLYMKGNEGAAWPWCAGFASFVLHQATASRNVPMPVKASFSCDVLAIDAQQRNIFLAGAAVASPGDIPPGSLFLSRRTSRDWVHTGIVLTTGAESFETIEGNTNDAGDREGYEVCRRTRGYKDKDFILVR